MSRARRLALRVSAPGGGLLLAGTALVAIPTALRGQAGPTIVDVSPDAGTVVTADADPLDQESDVDFTYCIDWDNPPQQFSQKGVLGFLDPADNDAVVRVDSTFAQNAGASCPQGWELGDLAGFPKGRWTLWFLLEVVDGQQQTFTDSTTEGPVWLFPTSPALTITTPQDSASAAASTDLPSLTASTDLGSSQAVRLVHRFTPEGGGAESTFRTLSTFTDANGRASFSNLSLDQGDGTYVLVAETDSVPIPDGQGFDSPGRDQIVRSLNQDPPGLRVVVPGEDSTQSERFEVRGVAQPDAQVRLDDCDGCDALNEVVTAAQDSAWSFGVVTFPNPGPQSLRVVATDAQQQSSQETVSFEVVPNQAPTVTIVEPTADTVSVPVGEGVSFAAQAADPDGDQPLSVVWDFSRAGGALLPGETPPDSLVGTEVGPVSFAPADTFFVTAVARDPQGAESS
nr:hypothetical protein [Gemmatimonadota bacterium]NIR79996.1 hypothetical protein [Gemmatimonadota bacterium]NIT88731.1 hypothetical protein [Gemmatimonadota bacterium]NIU32541.1 hypothetical protein [Gemmatimonadota bacterium]NIU37004.1 hypothetical protein [Gemmatimonadota bacterium]